MKRTYRFAAPSAMVACLLDDGSVVEAPVVPGLLKHATDEQLARLLLDPAVLRKYTDAALARASWPVLRCFPAWWLRRCLAEARLPPGRRRALEFLLRA